MKIQNGTMLVFGLVVATLSFMQAKQTAERFPASLVSGSDTLPRANPYSYSMIETTHASALYNEQVFRQSQSSNDMLLQALRVERADASARGQNVFDYDKRIMDLENKMLLTRSQQSTNLSTSLVDMLLNLASNRNGLSQQELQIATARARQLISLQYINDSGTGSLYEVPSLDAPGLTAQAGGNGNKYAALPLVDIPPLEDELPDDFMEEAPKAPAVKVPQAPEIMHATVAQ